MIQDREGNPLPGATAEAAAELDAALESFSLYCGDPVAHVNRAIAAAPQFTMAHAVKAWLFALATEPRATDYARKLAAEAGNLDLAADPRAASLLDSLTPLLGGDWSAAAGRLDRHNAAFPRDLLGIQAGHLVDFYRAGSRSLRDRIARVLPRWSPADPAYGVLLGMYAFGLEENGAYGIAEETGRRAIDLEPRDCWAHHAVAHVMEMQGRAQDGIGWMITREPHWAAEDNAFKVHNWWHRALWHLDLCDIDAALALYDGPIRGLRSSVALDLVDAAALLWRVELCGGTVGDRWNELADAWATQTDGNYPFNDWHAAMAALGAGRSDLVERLLANLRATRADSEVGAWARETALPLIEGFARFRDGDYVGTVEQLLPVRYLANRFGGSHAQRDVIDWTVSEAATRGAMHDIAEALANERLATRPHSPLLRGLVARVANTTTRRDDA
jgi:tetratricopeptide (TPR) repeat protein